jgi:tol-pal system protein YbgF
MGRAIAGIGLILLVSGPVPGLAQEAPWTTEPTVTPQDGPKDPSAGAGSAAKTAPAAKPQGADAGRGGAEGGDARLKQRVEQLEEQIVDMQVVIGTLETLARGGSGAATSNGSGALPAAGGGDQARLDGIETQIRALTAQVEQLANAVNGQGGVPRRSDAGASPTGGDLGSYSPPTGGSQAAGGAETERFGSTTVNSSSADPIGSLAGSDPSEIARAPLPDAAPPAREVAAATPDATGAANPKQLYEAAYGYLLQQNYSSAQSGFSEFLRKYPKDSLAPNALYWLGETHYVQRNFADAAEAFDLVTASFSSSSKAPDAMLKRGMALAQLGKRKEACAALSSVAAKFPSAPPLVKEKAESERQRASCP